jgi:hypothetical protein
MEYSDLNEIYPLIDYPYMTIRSEYGIGEYLFGIADAYKPQGASTAQSFDGIVVLKAGDTHWQKFATITDPQNPTHGESTFYSRALTLDNGTLRLLITSTYP